LDSDVCLKRKSGGCLNLARQILVENVDFSLPQGYFLLPVLIAEVNHFNSQISLAKNLDILCYIQGCSRADLGALLWGSDKAAVY